MGKRLRLWLERVDGGFLLRDAASGERVSWEDDRVRVVPLAGASFRTEALQDDAFSPGQALELVPEPDNAHDPNAVAVWNTEQTLHVGYVPAEIAPLLRGDEQALVLWEFREEGARVGLRILVAPPDAWIGRPREGGISDRRR
jgi:hypothetical protein